MEIQQVSVDNLRVLDNSRIRAGLSADAQVEELMKSLKQVGMIQPITARTKDNAVVCGNRRLIAAKKLGWKTVPVIFMNDVDDKDMFLMNLTENIQRKEISSIEIGRMCAGLIDGSLCGEKLSLGEIAIRLGETDNRIRTCIAIFSKLPKKYHKHIAYFGGKKRTDGKLPESTVRALIYAQNQASLKNDDFDILVEATVKNNLQPSQIEIVARLVLREMTVIEALEEVKSFRLLGMKLIIHKASLERLYKRYKVDTFSNLVKELIEEQDPNAVF